MGARRWILERRNCLARRIYYRLIAGDPKAGRQILAEAQWRLHTMKSAGVYSAFHLVFESYPVDQYGWGDQDEDLLPAQNSSVSGQFAQQWQPRMLAQGALLQEVANNQVRRPLAYSKTPNCTDVEIGDSVLL